MFARQWQRPRHKGRDRGDEIKTQAMRDRDRGRYLETEEIFIMLFILYWNYGEQNMHDNLQLVKCRSIMHHFGCSCNVAYPRESVNNEQCDAEKAKQRQLNTTAKT